MKLKYYLFLIFPVFINCKNQKNELPNSEKIIVRDCIENVLENAASFRDSSYIVNPHFAPFEFNNFIIDNYGLKKANKKRNKVLKIIGLNDDKFELLKKSINKKFLDKNFSDLGKMSNGKKSRRIIIFSGISEKLVFLDLITYLDEIDLNSLENHSIEIDKNRIKGVTSLAIILDKKKISQVVVLDGIVFER